MLAGVVCRSVTPAPHVTIKGHLDYNVFIIQWRQHLLNIYKPETLDAIMLLLRAYSL